MIPYLCGQNECIIMGYFILFFSLCTIAVFVYSWLQNHLSENGDRVYYIGDCRDAPGYADRGKSKGCSPLVFAFIFILALFILLQ